MSTTVNKIGCPISARCRLRLPQVDVMVRVHEPLFTVELVSITTGGEDVLTGSLRPHSWVKERGRERETEGIERERER